ncbi:MAG: hypothetical protein M3P93_02260, partial [Actinomycetota bacterium]|nr:hypothetical protein [Actinomycetota bacterium]
GWGPGPLTRARQARQRLLRRPVRLVLLERSGGTRFAPSHAFWLNRRSRAVVARVNGPVERADLVWVMSQDPLAPAVRRALARDLGRLRPGTPVLNPLATYDSYHADDAFPRLAAAGVRVPRTLGPADVGRTEAVWKRQGEQASHKLRGTYDGPRPGYRAFEAVDSRGPDGLHRRWRAWYVAGLVFPGDVVASTDWQAGLSTLQTLDRTFTLRPDEEALLRRAAQVLGLDAFAVDLLRPGGDGPAVLVDVNVYPTLVDGSDLHLDAGLPPAHGQWHSWDAPARAGVRGFPGAGFWAALDEALLAAAAGAPLASTGSAAGRSPRSG